MRRGWHTYGMWDIGGKKSGVWYIWGKINGDVGYTGVQSGI